MSVRRTRFSRRGIAAVAIATGLVLGVTGCSGESDSPKNDNAASENKNDGGEQQVKDVPASDEVLTRVEGPDGLVMTLNQVKRDSGGFVTVYGKIKNPTDEDFYGTGSWRGDEEEILEHGASLGGSVLVDKDGKKRYYVLRDTEGRPLCTTFPDDILAGKTVPIFAQFPAPPDDTTEVDFQIPGWPSAPVEIAG